MSENVAKNRLDTKLQGLYNRDEYISAEWMRGTYGKRRTSNIRSDPLIGTSGSGGKERQYAEADPILYGSFEALPLCGTDPQGRTVGADSTTERI
jgi:hypothetical protein